MQKGSWHFEQVNNVNFGPNCAAQVVQLVMVPEVFCDVPNVRVTRARAADRQTRAGENIPRTTSLGLGACRCGSA